MKAKITPEFANACYIFSAIEAMGRHDNRISSEGLLEMLKSGKSPSWNEIQSQFPKVIDRISDYAAKHKLNPKSIDAVRGYWLLEHNKLIDEKREEYSKMPDSQRVLCRTHLAQVVETVARAKGIAKLKVVDEYGKVLEVIDFFHDLKAGNYLSLHRNLVAEMLTPSEYKKYSKQE